MPATETTPIPQELTPRQRRALIVRTTLQALLTATLLVVLYHIAPLDSALSRQRRTPHQPE